MGFCQAFNAYKHKKKTYSKSIQSGKLNKLSELKQNNIKRVKLAKFSLSLSLSFLP
jgi:hypothetical protein